MGSSVPRTALPSSSRSSHDQLARGLGYFSLALGMAELVAPRMLCRAAGVEEKENLVRACGGREIATGLAIMTSHNATPWVWGRVAGDALDIATLAAAAKDWRRPGTVLALAALAGTTAVDMFCAVGLSAEKGGRRTARANYGDRSGFPRGVEAARGAARDFQPPRDMRTPDPLRPREAEPAYTPSASD